MSPIPRRVLLAAFAAVCLLPWPAHGQTPYPSQGIRLIVPYAPGGVPDTTARLLAQRLQDRVGQTVVVENRAGGNGGVAAAVIAAAPADGYTLLVVDTTLLNISPLFVSQLSYNPQKDFVPVALLARTPLFLAVSPDLGINTLREFIDYAKARPGQISYGSAGVGSTHQLTMEAMKSALHLDITHIPYRRHQPGGAGAARRPHSGVVGVVSQSQSRGRGRPHQASGQQRHRPVAAVARACRRWPMSSRGSIWSRQSGFSPAPEPRSRSSARSRQKPSPS